jgi:hypothetical protein
LCKESSCTVKASSFVPRLNYASFFFFRNACVMIKHILYYYYCYGTIFDACLEDKYAGQQLCWLCISLPSPSRLLNNTSCLSSNFELSCCTPLSSIITQTSMESTRSSLGHEPQDLVTKAASNISPTPDHLLSDSAPNLEPITSRWKSTISKIADTEVYGF